MPWGQSGNIRGPQGPTGPAGLNWRGAWSSTATYAVNDAVTSQGSSYRRKVAGTTATLPKDDSTNWELLAKSGLVWRGAWSSTTAYAVDDAVTYSGASYRRKVAGTTSTTPPNDTTNWELLAAKGDTGTAPANVVTTDTSQNISGAKTFEQAVLSWKDIYSTGTNVYISPQFAPQVALVRRGTAMPALTYGDQGMNIEQYVGQTQLDPATATNVQIRVAFRANGDVYVPENLETAKDLKANTVTPTVALAQSKTHASPDTDTATTALHHTLGTGANQAAAGDHTHDDRYYTEAEADGRFAAAGHTHTVTEDPWHEVGAAGEPTYQNNWAAFSPPTYNVRFRKDSAGNVWISGAVQSGTAAGIFTLPAGYAPPHRVMTGQYNAGGVARVDVTTAGLVTHVSAIGNATSLNIMFSTKG